MKKLNTIRIPVLFALFLGLSLSSWGQSEDNGASSGTPQTEMEAKQMLYEQLGVKWTYGDGASLDAAKEQMMRKSANVVAPGNDSPEAIEKNRRVEERNAREEVKQFLQNKAEVYQTEPTRYNEMVEKATAVNRIDITAAEYERMSPEQKKRVDSNPALYNVNGTSTK